MFDDLVAKRGRAQLGGIFHQAVEVKGDALCVNRFLHSDVNQVCNLYKGNIIICLCASAHRVWPLYGSLGYQIIQAQSENILDG